MTLRHALKIITVLFLGSIILACATPQRAVYSGTDTVGAVNKDMLIGHWNIRVLNPLEGEQASSADIHYLEDGNVILNSSGTSSGMTLGFEILGIWSIQGDSVSLTMESIRETSGNTMATLMMPLMNSMKGRMSGSANIYSVSANRVILVSSDGGQAQELTRVR